MSRVRNGGTIYFVPDPSGADGRGLKKSEYRLRKASELVRSGSGVFCFQLEGTAGSAPVRMMSDERNNGGTGIHICFMKYLVTGLFHEPEYYVTIWNNS